MKEETRAALVSAVRKAVQLNWVQYIKEQPMMHLADVEKTIIGAFEPDYLDNLLRVKEKDGKC